jgi:hypothetical protein
LDTNMISKIPSESQSHFTKKTAGIVRRFSIKLTYIAPAEPATICDIVTP